MEDGVLCKWVSLFDNAAVDGKGSNCVGTSWIIATMIEIRLDQLIVELNQTAAANGSQPEDTNTLHIPWRKTLTGGPRTANIIAQTNLDLMVIEREAFRHQLRQCPEA